MITAYIVHIACSLPPRYNAVFIDTPSIRSVEGKY